MNFSNFERAQVAAFAYREAHHTGNADCLRAICFILRNRLKGGWGDGSSWLSVIETAHLVSASYSRAVQSPDLASGKPGLGVDRLLQLIVRDVDEIYLAQDRFDDAVRLVVCGNNGKEKEALYYSFVGQMPRPWFIENIIRDSNNHPQLGTIGALMLYR